MTTDQLRYLIEISRSTSMTAASHSLHLTPQALSTSIKKLEDELGFSLLNRSFSGISLTPEGKWLVTESTAFLQKIDEQVCLHAEADTQSQYTGHLDVFYNYAGISDDIFGQLISNLYEQMPSLDIKLREMPKETIISRVLRGDVEFGVCFRTKYNDVFVDEMDDALIFEPLFDGRLIFATAPDSELAKFKTISLKKVVAYPLTAYFPGYETNISLEEFLTENFGLPIQYTCENNFSIFREKVMRGLANTLSVKFAINEYPANHIGGAKLLTLRDDVKVYFGLIYRKDTTFSINESYFLQELKALIARKLP